MSSSSSRETFRDDTLKKWVIAGIKEQKPGLSSNDKNNGYRFTSKFAALLRNYGTGRWEEELAIFNDTHDSYAELQKQVKEIEKGYPVNYCGLSFELGRSNHNKLQKLVLDEFAPRFAPGAELLYIGDTSDRAMHCNDERLKNLGINVFEKSKKMPDIVMYDATKNRILFVEAYTSTGEFNIDRVNEIKELCDCSDDVEVAFITAFLTTKKMLSVYKRIAWDTDIWVAEEVSHLTHKNGDKFLGRRLAT